MKVSPNAIIARNRFQYNLAIGVGKIKDRVLVDSFLEFFIGFDLFLISVDAFVLDGVVVLAYLLVKWSYKPIKVSRMGVKVYSHF